MESIIAWVCWCSRGRMINKPKQDKYREPFGGLKETELRVSLAK